jgi:hypothetical protein
MSLINDALKRAKAAQRQAEPPPLAGPQMRPVEAAHQVRRGMGILLPGALGLTALAALLLVWQISPMRGPGALSSQKPANSVADWSAPAPARAPSVAEPEPGRSAEPNLLAPAPSLAAPVTTSEASSTSPPPTATAAITTATLQTNLATNAGPIAESVPPKPAPLKLQAIVFNPARPSALVSGKTLFIGDRIGEFRLISLNKETATLASAAETKVLSLGE